MYEIIHGTVKHTFFSSPTFTAGIMKTVDGKRVKFSGKFHAGVGDTLFLVGEWETHPKYGLQFVARSVSYDLPETRDGLINYLANSRVFKGIGKTTAAKLVEYAGNGERLDQLIREGLHELRAALRIPMTTLETLREEWIAHTAEYSVRTEGRGRIVDEWQVRPSHPDNHFLDCLVGCAVAASEQGVVLPGTGGTQARKKPPIKLSKLRRRG